MTLNCYSAHKEWVIEYDNGIWICELCAERKRQATAAQGLLALIKAKAKLQLCYNML